MEKRYVLSPLLFLVTWESRCWMAGSDVTYFDLCAMNGIRRQLGGICNVLCDRMKNAWSKTCGTVAGPSRPRKTGKVCVLLNFNVVERNCVRKWSVCCVLYRVGYIDTVRGPSICTVDIKGLLKVVPEHGGGDKGNDYCIDGFAIDRYGELLTYCQQMFPDLCTQTVFVKTYQLVSAYVSNDLSAISTNITTLVFSSVLNRVTWYTVLTYTG